jgi:hypothetical protein
VLAAIEVPVDVEIVDGGVRPARTHERIEVPTLEEQRGAGAGLIAVVLADDTFLRDRIVGLADPGEQHQVHVVVDPMPKAGGKWSTMEITAKGRDLSIMFDGKKTASVRSGVHTEGPLALQFGEGVVKFRKVAIKPL